MPIAVGDIVVEGPNWPSERTGKEGHVTELREGEVKVKWSFFSRSWQTYSEERREVMRKGQLEEHKRQRRVKQERDEQVRQQLLHTSSDLQVCSSPILSLSVHGFACLVAQNDAVRGFSRLYQASQPVRDEQDHRDQAHRAERDATGGLGRDLGELLRHGSR